jgi:hypothetical protein
MDQEDIFVRYINDATSQKVVNELADGRGVSTTSGRTGWLDVSSEELHQAA